MSHTTKKLLLISSAIIILLILVAYMAGMFSAKITPGVNEIGTASRPQTFPVEEQTVALTEPVAASVEAKQATVISSRIMARITAIHVRAGDQVEEGQLLLELEQSDLLARSQQNREIIRAINARLAEAKQTLQRTVELHQQGLVATADLDRARANNDSLKAELASAQQQQQQADTALSYSRIDSPIAGRVVDRFAEPGDTATPGSKLLTLYNPVSLRVEAQVRENLALSLTLDQALQVEIPSLDSTFQATVEEIVPAAERGSHSFLIKARIPFQQALLPGMYARLLVPSGTKTAVVIPADKVITVGQLNAVWVWQDNHYQQRLVRVGRTQANGYIEIISGLEKGEWLINPPAKKGEL